MNVLLSGHTSAAISLSIDNFCLQALKHSSSVVHLVRFPTVSTLPTSRRCHWGRPTACLAGPQCAFS